MNRTLVTGATGFTSRFVIPLLHARGFDVRGLSTADCDIRDLHGVRNAIAAVRPDYVVHLAGTPNVPESEAELAYSVNVQGTVNLLDACERLAERPKKIILASSSYVYGDTGTEPADEDAPLEPTGAYGKSKCEMEHAAARWFNRLPILIVRPFNYTGVGHGKRFLVPKLVQVFRERTGDVSFVDPDVVRDYSDVRWVATVYADLLEHTGAGFAVNVCSGIGTPLPVLVNRLEEITDYRVAKTMRPAQPYKTRALVGDPARLLKILGAPSPYSLADTLRWMLSPIRDREAPETARFSAGY